MVIAALMLGAGVVIELCAVVMAPFGYQDETGFHIGTERTGSNKVRPQTNPS
jgi:hypothetical protein